MAEEKKYEDINIQNDEINELINSLVKELMPIKIYLFGSYAENNENEDSDFDFYIVVNDTEFDMVTLTARAYNSIRYKQKRSVDIIVNTESVFHARKKILSTEKEVFERGVLIYAEQQGMMK